MMGLGRLIGLDYIPLYILLMAVAFIFGAMVCFVIQYGIIKLLLVMLASSIVGVVIGLIITVIVVLFDLMKG
ncbi:hypothetical protein [Ligilactobacillus salivarius]|uniref:hypothetical protein n=1 Tax=Ligilactobacillus salivarius TaxID=1624 RepID=UPI000BAFF70E|nr:hypothetical protein [Ligilactobacillus salivarius]PAY51908.1 hypothetical protein A8C37_00795 [Ligilactobacillus salivarius]